MSILEERAPGLSQPPIRVPEPAACARLRGRLAVVTGATRGIGLAVAEGLVARGIGVVVVGRDPRRGEQALARLRRIDPDARLHFAAADLGSIRAVEMLAAAIAGLDRPVDYLVHNAAVVTPTRSVTCDGIERQLMVNHLAPVLLTRLLLPALWRAEAPRIVVTASQLEEAAAIDFEDLNSGRSYDGARVYAMTKLANLLFCYALARRLGGRPTANALHPGSVRTALLERLVTLPPAGRVARALHPLRAALGAGLRRARLKPPALHWALAPAEGAQTTLAVALAPELEGITGCWFSELQARQSSAASRDEALQERLWTASAQLLGIPGDWPAADAPPAAPGA